MAGTERWIEEIEDWEVRRVPSGFEGLAALAADDFSGAVDADDAWLFLVKGNGVGVFEYRPDAGGATVFRGEIDSFEGADLTAHVAPHPSIPLLVAMEAGETTTRARYYTEDTPIPEVHETLTDGGFTGYLELSENVLSGDYYVVYQAGRSMEVAFVGTSRRLETDEDAFERACGEVGIYEVVAADLDPVELPQPEPEPEPDPAPSPERSSGSDSDPAPSPEQDLRPEPPSDARPESESEPESEPEPESPSADAGGADATAGRDGGGGAHGDADDPLLDRQVSFTIDEGAVDAPDDADAVDGPDGDADREPGKGEREVEAEAEAEGEEKSQPEEEADGDAVPGRVVPALDPARTGTGGPEGTDAGGGGATPADDGDGATAAAAPDELRDRLAELEATIENLRDREPRRDAGASDPGDGPRAGSDSEAAAARSIPDSEAISGTNLFVRYRSKGAATLSDATGGDATPEDLADNLRIEHHTEFDPTEVTVDGVGFESWLADTHRFRFVRWLVGQLPFEIRETGSRDGLRDLFDALPEIDRVELDGTVAVGPEATATFDLVVRDRMGEPLVVAEIDPEGTPVGKSGVADLVRAATDAVEAGAPLAAAFYVTEAFFRPPAMEVAREASSGSLLSRDSRRSFVRVTRSRGYHLCLVEARDDSMYLTLPDL